MTEYSWNRVPPEQSMSVLEHVTSTDNAAVFSKRMTEVTACDLPFYDNFKHYRLTNYATLPSFTMDYIARLDENVFFTLDGTANTIYDINDADPVNITADNVIAYLDFFFKHVQGPDGDIYFIKEPDDLPMLSSLPENQRESVIQKHVPMAVESDIRDGEYHVTGTLFYGGSLISARIQVLPKGQLSIHDQVLLLHNIHFPQSPVEYTHVSDS